MLASLPLELWIELAAILAVGAVIVLVLLLTRGGRVPKAVEEAANRSAHLEEGLQNLYAAQSEIGGRLGQLTDVLTSSQAHLSQVFEERLDAVHTRLGHGLMEQTERTHESLSELAQRLALIDEAQRSIIDLSGQVVGLQEILSNRQARGLFGEVQLEALVRDALPPAAYLFQAQLKRGGGDKRVDCLIKLPNPPGPIAVDAKFPLEAFQAMREAADETARAQAARAFKGAVLTHVKQIAERYIVPGETADSALMFLPSEAVYAELHSSFPDVIAESFKRRVWIVSPTTLMATLLTVRGVLKDARMREQAGVIQVEVGRMTEDVRRLTERVSRLQQTFTNSEGAVREILVSTERIARRIKAIENVQTLEEPGETPRLNGEVRAETPPPAEDTPAEPGAAPSAKTAERAPSAPAIPPAAVVSDR